MAEIKRELILKGVRQNNIKDVDLILPLGRRIIVTGPSGSGKSSLAFETIYAEGQRRYMQSLSTYARQFLERFKAPLVEKIQNIPPTIALEQVNPVRNSRATVATTTEIADHLRLLYEKVGVEYCSRCDIPKKRLSQEEIFESLLKKYEGKAVVLSFLFTPPTKKEDVQSALEEHLRSGYSRIISDGEVLALEDYLKAPPKKPKELFILVDRITLKKDESTLTRFSESLRQAMSLGKNESAVFSEENRKTKLIDTFTTFVRCPQCKEMSLPKQSNAFSFNSPLGACARCKGFGNTLEVDEDLVIPNPALALSEGAIDPFTKPSLKKWQKKLLEFCKESRIDADLAYRELPKAQRDLVWNGSKKFKGVKGVFKLLEEDKYKMQIRVFISRYTSPFTCPECNGDRLNPTALVVKIDNRNIAEIMGMTLGECCDFLKKLKLTPRERKIAEDILIQLDRRLDYLITVGLDYITLSRMTKTLSGGEYQRILLATQLSQGLSDTMYVLDEPSIGLHPKDTAQLLKVLNRLHELGNSLVVVEHDPEVIEWGEHIVDMGPGSGSRGGEVVFEGSRHAFFLSDTLTSKSVKDWRMECRHALLRPLPKDFSDAIEIKGAQGNNLKNIDIQIPLKRLVTVTGVSGSGKSTLVVDTLYKALAKVFHQENHKIEKFESMSGMENLNSVELIDQTPIGKSSRSNPLTFIKGYDDVRSLLASTPESTARGLSPGYFSFNVPGGRCDACEGEGRIKIDMVFMEDVWVPCQTCDEKRFKPSILAIRYKGKNIHDILKMTVDEALDFFKGISSLRTKLSLLVEVGLGYLQLGQSGFTLSGGEAQRLKIARELSVTSASRSATLFIFDEPTTGLHFNEVAKLITVLRKLIANGHSVVVIEHNLQLICSSDYIIDLGPDGGDRGGHVVGMGTPKELASKKLPYTSMYLSEILGI